VICNEFCGVGHHMMLGRVLVTNEDGSMPGEAVTAAEVK
jgi:heme/copper-type cytochrome/quinol oxidase subunit 2